MIFDTVNQVEANKEIMAGYYVRFDGHGIMSGLQQRKNKASFYKIVSFDDEGLHIKSYRARRGCLLPVYQFNQGCEVITKKEFVPLPEY